MLSIILASRIKNNPDSNIKALLDSALTCVEDPDKIEFLIKYDSDDNPPEFSQYPFTIKTFQYDRGEGRHYNHHHCEYLFANRNPEFKWVMNTSDDFVFTRSGFLKDLEEIKDDLMVVGFTYPSFLRNASERVYRECFPQDFAYDHGIGEYCPVLTAKLVEVCQNMGWQPNLDAWLVLLEVTLFQYYGTILWTKIEPFYKRTGTYGSGDTPTYPGKEIYNNMTITGIRLPKNQYYFKLIEQQARNIYLNLKYGTDHQLTPEHHQELSDLLHQ